MSAEVHKSNSSGFVYLGARLLRRRGRWEVEAPQLAAAVAGPVIIPLQFESFYTFPTKNLQICEKSTVWAPKLERQNNIG